MSNLFEECINGKFILKTTEPQDLSLYLNDGSHYIPSGLNRSNQLGVIQDADTMLPFAYDAKSANGVFLTDDMVQVREPTLCFDINPFGRVEPPYPIETNMDTLNTMNTYPDGTLINPSALTVRQTDNQIIQTPASQASTLQNEYLTARMAEYQEENILQKIYQLMLDKEKASEQQNELDHTEGNPAPQQPPEMGTDTPERIFQTETEIDGNGVEQDGPQIPTPPPMVQTDLDEFRRQLIRFTTTARREQLLNIAATIGTPAYTDNGSAYTVAQLRPMIKRRLRELSLPALRAIQSLIENRQRELQE